MARLPRLVVPGLPHHVIQRGNDRQAIFRDDTDRRRYLEILLDVARTHHVAIHAYVLMDNHVHLLASPETADALSRVMQSLGRRYVGWFNARHRRTGTLWEGRFRAAVVDSERYLLMCMRYIELNPVRAAIVAKAGEFPWSSAAHHLGQRQDALITDHPLFWALGNTPFEREMTWRSQLDQGVEHAEAEKMARSALKGWACGDADFLAWLRAHSDRPAAPRPRGRPPTRGAGR